MQRQTITLVTPALADANNGNWQTAARWARMLSNRWSVRICREWQGGDESLMIALHARRSAPSIRAWQSHHPGRPLVLVMTGTDLYRDIRRDAAAMASLEQADRLVVLNDLGAKALPDLARRKAVVILQTCPARRRLPRTRRHLRAVVVGHLRSEKSPQTVFEVVEQLAARDDILIDHIGAALEPSLGEKARDLADAFPQYRWLGGLSHAETRRRIQAAHVLVHPSRLEGGAHAVIEAVRSGTPVLASGIDGNIGLLGEDYEGYFPVGDARALAALLVSARELPGMLDGLGAQCDARAPLFDPAREQAALHALVGELLIRH